jgi:hypothetical protein
VSQYRFVYQRRTRLATGHDKLINLGDSQTLIPFPVDFESYTHVISTLEDVRCDGFPKGDEVKESGGEHDRASSQVTLLRAGC